MKEFQAIGAAIVIVAKEMKATSLRLSELEEYILSAERLNELVNIQEQQRRKISRLTQNGIVWTR